MTHGRTRGVGRVAAPGAASIAAANRAGLTTVRNPTRATSQSRSDCNSRLFCEIMEREGAPIDDPSRPFRPWEERPPSQSPVAVARSLMMARCGAVMQDNREKLPPADRFGGLKGESTAGNIKTAVVNLFRDFDCEVCGDELCRHTNGPYVALGKGAFKGNPGQAVELKTIIERIIDAQALAKSNVTVSAFAPSYADMTTLYEIYCKPVALRAMRGEYPGRGAKEFDMNAFQAWVILQSEHGTVGRADEIILLDCEELDFTGKLRFSSSFLTCCYI